MTDPVSTDNAIGRVSRMDAINNKSVVEAAFLKAEERMKKLNAILGIIDDPGLERVESAINKFRRGGSSSCQ